MAGSNVPPVTFGADGFIIPAESAVLAGVQADINQAFGGNLNFTTSSGSAVNATPQNQLASSEAAIINSANQTFLYYTTQVDPAYAQGRMQDAIGRIYFIERLPAQSTVVQCLCTGLPQTLIPFGSVAEDTSGNLYTSTADATISNNGSVTVQFAANNPGPTPCPAGTLTTIYQAVNGWDTITNQSDGVLGTNVESRAAFEERRAASVAGNSFGAIGSILGAVSEVPGVLDYYGYDNGTPNPVTVLGQVVAANSIFICVSGGAQAAVAQAIWSKKAPGCAYTGNTTVVVVDPNPLYQNPPAYNVTYETPASLEVLFTVNLVNSAAVPSNAVALVQAALVNAFAGGDGGARARIASDILATRFIAPVNALGAWAQVRTLAIGSGNTPSATFTASISGTTLTVSSITQGSIAVGQTLNGTGGSNGTGVAPGTTITALAGGTGGTGAYTISISQAVQLSPMTAALANQSNVQVQANQVPVLNAANIAVTVT